MDKTNIRMQRDIFSGNIEIQMVELRRNAIYVAQPLELKEIKEGEYAPPFLKITPTEAQQMIDELWNCGVRPSEGTGSAGALMATQSHLEDMKKIAFKLMKIEG